MSHRNLFVLLAVGAGLVAVSGCREAPVPSAPPPPEVVVATPVKRDVREVYEFTGRTEAIASVEKPQSP